MPMGGGRASPVSTAVKIGKVARTSIAMNRCLPRESWSRNRLGGVAVDPYVAYGAFVSFSL